MHRCTANFYGGVWLLKWRDAHLVSKSLTNTSDKNKRWRGEKKWTAETFRVERKNCWHRQTSDVHVTGLSCLRAILKFLYGFVTQSTWTGTHVVQDWFKGVSLSSPQRDIHTSNGPLLEVWLFSLANRGLGFFFLCGWLACLYSCVVTPQFLGEVDTAPNDTSLMMLRCGG